MQVTVPPVMGVNAKSRGDRTARTPPESSRVDKVRDPASLKLERSQDGRGLSSQKHRRR